MNNFERKFEVFSVPMFLVTGLVILGMIVLLVMCAKDLLADNQESLAVLLIFAVALWIFRRLVKDMWSRFIICLYLCANLATKGKSKFLKKSYEKIMQEEINEN